MTARVAAIDCGTNSLRLLIAEGGTDGPVDVDRRMRIVRLGQDVDRTGRLHPDAMARTEQVLAQYALAIAAADVGAVRMVATSAVRDADNRADFEAMVHRVLGQAPDILSGLAEAQLSFTGACAALPVDTGRVLVADIGGGSTELVVGGRSSGLVEAGASIDMGSVRLTERFVRSDPPSASEQAAIRSTVVSALRAAPVPDWNACTLLVGVAGTVTTVAALALGLTSYDSARVEGATLSRGVVEAAVAQLLASTRAQRLATGVVHPGRVDVIAAGAVILQELMRHLDAPDLVVTEHDILDGIAAGLLG